MSQILTKGYDLWASADESQRDFDPYRRMRAFPKDILDTIISGTIHERTSWNTGECPDSSGPLQ